MVHASLKESNSCCRRKESGVFSGMVQSYSASWMLIIAAVNYRAVCNLGQETQASQQG